MQSLIQRARNAQSARSSTGGLTSQQAYDLARLHLERGRQEDYLVWTMIAEFLEAVEKQAEPRLN